MACKLCQEKYISTSSESTSRGRIEPIQSKSLLKSRLIKRFIRSRKRLVRFGIVSLNVALLVAVVVFVLGADSSQQPEARSILGGTDSEIAGPLDQVSSADIAVNVARLTYLPEATSVVNHADSVNATLLAPQADNSIVAKPAVIDTSLPTKYDIQRYVVKSGDSISKIARAHGVSSDSVRWSNGLTGDDVSEGTVLYLPPAGFEGIVYKVKDGDTPKKLAEKYNTDKDDIISFNDAEIAGLKVGERIVIPDGSLSAPRPALPTAYAGFAFGYNAQYGFNGYDYGWCTWYTANRRQDIGRPIPANLGDAYTWVHRARLAGLGVGSTPKVGAVIWTNTYYPGHVGFVEEVLADGSAWVTDMNSSGQVSRDNPAPAGGWGQVSWRKVSPSEFSRYQFIY